jgi:uroporphyrin-III C-methyltransferase
MPASAFVTLLPLPSLAAAAPPRRPRCHTLPSASTSSSDHHSSAPPATPATSPPLSASLAALNAARLQRLGATTLPPPSLLPSASSASNSSLPAVHLVGTGPGDPGLLTLAAVALMRDADVVLYDRLVSPEILAYVNPAATMIYVGKRAGFHTRAQPDIHALLEHFAGGVPAGKVVVRLKGGDPFVFGRGGEEVEYLEERGVPVCVTPGITAAAGISARIGVPLTQRGTANAVKFLTGHLVDGEVDDVGAVEPGTTLVVYMGLSGLRGILAGLRAKGLREGAPAVAVEKGTCRDQRVVWGTVDELADRVQSAALVSPTLVFVGEVVALAPGWKRYAAEAAGQDADASVDADAGAVEDAAVGCSAAVTVA